MQHHGGAAFGGRVGLDIRVVAAGGDAVALASQVLGRALWVAREAGAQVFNKELGRARGQRLHRPDGVAPAGKSRVLPACRAAIGVGWRAQAIGAGPVVEGNSSSGANEFNITNYLIPTPETDWLFRPAG